MNVKKATETTFWLIFWFTGFGFLLPTIRQLLPNEVIFMRFIVQEHVGGGFLLIANIALLIVIISGTLDAILNNKMHFHIFNSFSPLIGIAIPTIILPMISMVMPWMFFGIYQLLLIIGLYWAFRKMTYNNSYSGQKLISFIKGFKNGTSVTRNHISDHYAAIVMSLALIVMQAIMLISLIVFAIENWQIFL